MILKCLKLRTVFWNLSGIEIDVSNKITEKFLPPFCGIAGGISVLLAHDSIVLAHGIKGFPFVVNNFDFSPTMSEKTNYLIFFL